MADIPELEIADWNVLLQLADHLDVGNGLTFPYVYRGQEDVDWKLIPSLHRAVTKDGTKPLPPSDKLLQVEDKLTAKFRAIAATHLPPATVSTTRHEVDWWLLMRHYGVPTRLLDWTKSLYVGLYFAVSRFPDKDGGLYLVHTQTFYRAMKQAHGDGAHKPPKTKAQWAIYKNPAAPPVLNLVARQTALLDRMVAQQSTFMLGRNVSTDFEAELAREMPKVAAEGKETLRKLRIKADLKPDIMRRLRAMNITAASLFPGLDGIGRQLEELARNL